MRSLLFLCLLLGTVGCRGKSTTAERVATYGEAVKARLAPACQAQGVAYPPPRFTLIGLKAEKRLELWAPDAAGQPRLIKAYPILAASGGAGPKLREGDRQVPEGLYAIESLNPNSRFHLALRVNYPNADDRRRAQADGRTQLGGDIMIHGSNASIGCLAMGDEAAENLFVLAADTGLKNIEVVLTPVDFRLGKNLPKAASLPPWSESLYESIKTRLRDLPTSNPR